MSKAQLKILDSKEDNPFINNPFINNPFITNEMNIQEVCQDFMILDEDITEDKDIALD